LINSALIVSKQREIYAFCHDCQIIEKGETINSRRLNESFPFDITPRKATFLLGVCSVQSSILPAANRVPTSYAMQMNAGRLGKFFRVNAVFYES
jgi:hypothetical protein